MLSAPASIPITTVATFASLLAPTDPGSRRPRRTTPGIPRRCHNDAACSSPACDTRFGSSKLTSTRLNSCDARIRQMPSPARRFCPSTRPKCQQRRASAPRHAQQHQCIPVHPGSGWLMIRRSLTNPTDCAYYLCSAPPGDHPDHPGRGRRETLGHRGDLPDRQGRSGPGPLPSPTLRRLVPTDDPRDVRARLPHRHPRRQRGKRGASDPSEDLIPFTVPEVRRLLSKLIWNRPANPTAVLDWSNWRRRHQARAKRSHYAAHHVPP